MEEYPFSRLEKTLLGKEVTILGVTHDGDNFRRYKDFYERRISESDAVILEAGVLDFDPSSVTPEDTPEDSLAEFEDFFRPVLEIAKNKGKRVFISDPFNEPASERDEKLGKILQSHLSVPFTGGVVTVTGTFFKSYELFCAGVAIQLIPLVLDNYSNSLIPPLVKWSYHDYRDIKIAQGIRSLCEKIDGQRITAIHGDDHSKGISFYLDHPTLASLKLHPYSLLEREAKEQGTHKIREIMDVVNEVSPFPNEEIQLCPELSLYGHTEHKRSFQQVMVA